jgi:RNA recognition motif-containing protein
VEEEKKIYIGNLEYGVAESDLARILEEKGLNAKDITVITDKYSGRSKGFGFAEFETAEDAQKAIDALNGQELNGRALRVSKAQKMKPRRDRSGGGGGGRFNQGPRY